MENLNIILFICLAIPLSMMLMVFRGHSKMLCGFLLTGMFVCVFSGEINTLVSQQFNIGTKSLVVNIAPLVEEISKAVPVIFVAVLLKPNRQTMAEYAIALAVGFATIENVSALMQAGSVSFSYALIRAIGAGVMHGICTLTVGVAMKTLIDRKSVFFSGTLAALSVAVIYHSVYNMLITSRLMIVGAVMPVLTFVVFMIGSIVQNKKSKKVAND